MFASKNVVALPFPANDKGLTNFTTLRSKHPDVEEQLGIKVGDTIVITWDGRFVRYEEFTWSVLQLCQEIDWGAWEIVEQ